MLPEPLLAYIGASRIRVECDIDRILLTPAHDTDALDGGYIDPADYPDTTAYLNAIPGMAESIIASMNAPTSAFFPASEESFRV
jgi:hypothetical protein